MVGVEVKVTAPPEPATLRWVELTTIVLEADKVCVEEGVKIVFVDEEKLTLPAAAREMSPEVVVWRAKFALVELTVNPDAVEVIKYPEPVIVLAPTFKALVIVSSLTSIASVMVPDEVCLINRPSTVVPPPEASSCANTPVEEEVRSMPCPVPELVIPSTAPVALE